MWQAITGKISGKLQILPVPAVLTSRTSASGTGLHQRAAGVYFHWGENCMKTASTLLASLIAFAVTPVVMSAKAVVLDLSVMSCRQFIESKPDDIAMVLTWIDGWYKGDSDEALIDTEVFTENAKKFGAYCATNPGVSIVTAAERILGK
jgi:acid stress chaperone HdeB